MRVVVFGLFGLFLLYLVIHSIRYRRKLRERDRAVRTASAEAAEDDACFASDELERHAVALFRAAQMAWDARDREGPRKAGRAGPARGVGAPARRLRPQGLAQPRRGARGPERALRGHHEQGGR